jgi:hypothetical protein
MLLSNGSIKDHLQRLKYEPVTIFERKCKTINTKRRGEMVDAGQNSHNNFDKQNLQYNMTLIRRLHR